LGQQPSPAAAAAADGELQQEMRLLQVIVDNPVGAEAVPSASRHRVPQAEKQQQEKQQQQQQRRQPSSKSAADSLAEQLVYAARTAQQQLRWQQLQHSLKSAAASGGGSSSSNGSSGSTRGTSQQQHDVQASLAQLQGLVKKGSWPEAESLVEELQPGLLKDNPSLRFELKRCQFMQVGVVLWCKQCFNRHCMWEKMATGMTNHVRGCSRSHDVW
jgi:hypothetical protein